MKIKQLRFPKIGNIYSNEYAQCSVLETYGDGAPQHFYIIRYIDNGIKKFYSVARNGKLYQKQFSSFDAAAEFAQIEFEKETRINFLEE